jgi:hypothetical protein
MALKDHAGEIVGAAVGGTLGAVFGASFGLATAGWGIPATAPFAAGGAGLGATAGRWIQTGIESWFRSSDSPQSS